MQQAQLVNFTPCSKKFLEERFVCSSRAAQMCENVGLWQIGEKCNCLSKVGQPFCFQQGLDLVDLRVAELWQPTQFLVQASNWRQKSLLRTLNYFQWMIF